jgi:tetratricopeptide (TPR) repeat protein
MRIAFLLACCALVTAAASAQSRATLETSETVFSVLTAMNACGYDQELSSSLPLRSEVRADVAHAVEASEPAWQAMEAVCAFYRDHQQADSSRQLAQYVSLALSLGEPPSFQLAVKESELPPDAGYILGFAPLVQRFYQAAGLHGIWERHKPQYDALVEQFHAPVSNMLLGTDVYLKIPVSGYVNRQFFILLDPMAGPGQVNSRNYGLNHYILVAPENNALRIDAIRHTYLHFTLDPLVAKRSASSMKRLDSLLFAVKAAPMAEYFKEDVRSLLGESLIRAVEARMSVSGKTKQAESKRAALAQKAAEEGFILAPYFETQLAKFEQGPESLQEVLPDWVFQLDVGAEQKRAAGIVFAKAASSDDIQRMPARISTLDEAGNRFAAGDLKRARQLAEQALEDTQEDKGRAYFILAQVAAKEKDPEHAEEYFQRATSTARDPNVTAWSHIYLGRICDLKDERDAAVQHYQQALAANATDSAARKAAQTGIAQPYASPVQRQPESKDKE